jgi:hypothetical protein
MVDTANITATFGPARGDRTTLSTSCLATLDTIYQHPLSHNLKWPDVIALFAKLGTVKHQSNNEFVFAIGGAHHLMRKAHGKTLSADDVVKFRHMLTWAGWSPVTPIAFETAEPMPTGGISPTGLSDLADVLVAVEHGEARIYQLDIAAADQSDHVIKPYDPHHFLHHLSHKDQSGERGQRVAEDPNFYARIAEALRPAGRIVVVGHGDGHSNAAHHLTVYLQQHHKDIYKKLSPEVEADLSNLTAPQLLALGRRSLAVQAGIGKAE